MVIKKCDRCGAVIEEKKKSFFQRITDSLAHKTTYVISKSVGGEVYLVDLCESCEEKLHEFLQGERKLYGKEIRQGFMDEIKVEK